MNIVMLQQTIQTKYHYQVHLHHTEIIIIALDTILDPHNHRDSHRFNRLRSHSHSHRYRSHSQSNSKRSHSRSYHGHPHRSTSYHRHSNTYSHRWDTPHRRSSLDRSSSAHSRDCSRSKAHTWHKNYPYGIF